MKRSRRKDWRSGFLFSPCKGCAALACIETGAPCRAVEAILATVTHTERDAGIHAEKWGDMTDCEQFARVRGDRIRDRRELC